jgi:hypothetical protein
VGYGLTLFFSLFPSLVQPFLQVLAVLISIA